MSTQISMRPEPDLIICCGPSCSSVSNSTIAVFEILNVSRISWDASVCMYLYGGRWYILKTRGQSDLDLNGTMARIKYLGFTSFLLYCYPGNGWDNAKSRKVIYILPKSCLVYSNSGLRLTVAKPNHSFRNWRHLTKNWPMTALQA